MASQPIKNAEYVEVVIPSGNTKSQIYFPDLPNLRNKPILGMEAYTANEQSTSFSGASVVTATLSTDVTITLYYDGGEYIQVPFASLRRIANGASGAGIYQHDIPNLAGQNVVWTKSYVSMNASPSSFAGKNFVFSVYYQR